jgi:hypothetical protein
MPGKQKDVSLVCGRCREPVRLGAKVCPHCNATLILSRFLLWVKRLPVSYFIGFGIAALIMFSGPVLWELTGSRAIGILFFGLGALLLILVVIVVTIFKIRWYARRWYELFTQLRQ